MIAVILPVYTIRMADAMHALLHYLARRLLQMESSSSNLQQSCCKQKHNEDLARKGDIELP
jgi:hypothetical protein